jgi:fructose-bisphosphate aldolase class I
VIEPEVLMDGAHAIDRCGDVTGQVLQAVFAALYEHRVSLEALLVKPNMVVAGLRCAHRPADYEIASATVRCLQRHVPVAVPGVVFLSGGQDYMAATVHLSAINRVEAAKPWKLSFSYGRPLQDEALALWNGKPENVAAAQRAFCHRARCVSAAALGRYTTAMEHESAVA